MKIFDLLFCSASEGAAAVKVPSGAPLTRKQLKGKVQAGIQGKINRLDIVNRFLVAIYLFFFILILQSSLFAYFWAADPKGTMSYRTEG